MNGRKFTTCNICGKYFPKRQSNDRESVPSRIDHLREHLEEGKIQGVDRIDLRNYRLFLHYSPIVAAANWERRARQHLAKQRERQ
jgi:hypothetical protein